MSTFSPSVVLFRLTVAILALVAGSTACTPTGGGGGGGTNTNTNANTNGDTNDNNVNENNVNGNGGGEPGDRLQPTDLAYQGAFRLPDEFNWGAGRGRCWSRGSKD